MNHILKSLLTWLCFAGTTFFAAGAVIDAGAGAGNESIVDDGAGADDAAGAGGADDAALSDDGAGAGDDAAAAGAEKTGDGRTLPKNVQSALKTFKEAHPELAKEIDELRKGYFDSRGHREFFKSPAEARQAKATLELVGGATGIAELQSKISAVEQVDQAFETGDPQVLDDIASDFPDGFKKLVGPALDKLQSLDPKAYFATMQPHTFAAMEAAGLGSVLEAIGQAIAGKDEARAKDLIGKSVNWYKGQEQQAGARKNSEVDPERQKFLTERAQFNTDKEKGFREDIGRDTSSYQNAEVTKALAPHLKAKAFSADERADITSGINSRVNAILKADANYQGTMKSLLSAKNRDPEKIKQYVKAAVSTAVQAAVKSRYGKNATARTVTTTTATTDKGAKTSQQNPANAGPVKIAAKPNRDDVDWAKTKDILYITNKAYMKNGPHKGKLVTW